MDFAALRNRQSELRARSLRTAQKKSDMLAQLNRVGRAVAAADDEEASLRTQEKQAKDEQLRQERLRAAQQATLAQQEAENGIDLDEYSFRDWHEGLYDHQEAGILFGAAARRWVCGDEPGLGKTRQAIGWMDAVGARKVIVFAPTEVAGQFANEIRELADHRQVIELHDLSPKIREERQRRILETDDAVVVLNYEAFRGTKTDIMGTLLAWRADTVIADEAHLMKNNQTANYKNVQRIVELDLFCGKCGGEVPCLTRHKTKPDGSPSRVVEKVPCQHCGWRKGEPTGYDFPDAMSKIQHTRSVKNIMLTTGTPLLNAPDELYTLFHLARPDLFPNLESFKKTFTYTNAAGHRFFTKKGLENLRIIMKPIYLARKKADAGIILPDRDCVDVMVPIQMSEYPEQRTVIDQIAKFSQIQLANGQKLNIMDQLAQLTRQRQANVFPGGIEVTDRDEDGELRVVFTTEEIEEAAKMDSIEEHIEKHAGERQVIFSKFSTALVKQEERLKSMGYRVCRLDGSTPRSLRKQIKTNFYRAKGEVPKWDIVLVNYQTGGAGLNLTACTVTHVLDSEWNPGMDDQALGRTFRIGQTDETTVYRYLVPRSVDTRVESIKRRKQKLVDAFERGELSRLEHTPAEDLAEALGNI